jgi:predicted thioredoxin/glutaredoxin
MSEIDLIFSKDSSEDVAVKNLLREIKLEHPRIVLKELEQNSPGGKKIIDELGILSLPAIIIDGELFSTGMIEKEEILAKIRGQKV